MERSLEHELLGELELEGELEGELELEGESELEAAGELEAEGELAGELEGEGEGELELEGEGELELEGEGELGELELEFEQGEQFLKFGRLFKGIGGLVKRAAPMLKNIARVAAPIAGKAVGGFLGGPAGAALGSKLAGMAAQRLRELEFEGAQESLELEYGELEYGEMGELEGELELGEQEVSSALAEHEAQAELMAHYAAFTESEYEAEAMTGAATTMTMSPEDRRALRKLVPNLVRGAGILTRVLRMRRETRPFTRTVPTIVRRTVRSLRRGAAAGRPITRQRAGEAMARQTRRVLGSPRYCAAVLRRNVRASARTAARPGAVTPNGRRRASAV